MDDEAMQRYAQSVREHQLDASEVCVCVYVCEVSCAASFACVITK
jgi:hypothetical protein